MEQKNKKETDNITKNGNKIIATLWRIVFYITGMLVLAFGIILNTKSGLGVSPLISVSFVASHILNQNFGDMTLVLYSSYIIIEIVIHLLRKKYKNILFDLLQFPVSLVFTRVMNLFGGFIPELATECQGLFWGGLTGRILALLVAFLLTGLGIVLTVNMKIIPNPGDGVVSTVADYAGKNIGFMKNVFDITSVIISVFAGILLLGKPVGIGIGTLLAAILIGRIVALFNGLFGKKMKCLAGLPETV